MDKKLVIFSLVLISVFFIGCSTRQLTQSEKEVRQISDTTNCKFIDSVYFDARPNTITHYARVNTVVKGGNAYKFVHADTEKVLGASIIRNTIDVYKCDFK